MMIWDANNPNPLPPLQLFDANGTEIHFVTWCNTETGEVKRVDHSNGILKHVNGDVIILAERHPAPLSIVPKRAE